MKKLLVLACATLTLSLAAGAAMADSIKGKVGVTGKIGFVIPSDSDFNGSAVDTSTGFIFGGGLIYGIDNHFAAELGVTRSDFDSNRGDFGVTDLAVGGQYRFALSQPQLVPYLGGGLDLLLPDGNGGHDVDTTVGVHAIAGLDYFLTRQLALTTEAKLLLAPDTDINGPNNGDHGNFDPTCLSTTFGVRYFF